jgi:hypothetical protein
MIRTVSHGRGHPQLMVDRSIHNAEGRHEITRNTKQRMKIVLRAIG